MATIAYREADGLDISNIYRLIKAEHEDLKIPYPMISSTKLPAYIGKMLVDGKVWVASLSGRIIGAVVCSVARPLWTDLWLINGDFLVVDKHFRKHGVAQNLIRLMTKFAGEKRLPVWLACTTGGVEASIKDRFLAMQGLEYMGGTFLFWPKDIPPKQV